MSGNNNNKMRWELESVFPGGSASTEFAEFRQAIATDLEKAEKSLAKLPARVDNESRSGWVAFFLLIQHLAERIGHASGFTSCLVSQDVSDEKAQIIDTEIFGLSAAWESLLTGIEDFAIKVDDDAWKDFLTHEKLTGTLFFWKHGAERYERI